MSEIPRRILHTVQETQSLLGVSQATIYRLLNLGLLKSVKLGRGTRITRDSIEAFANEGCGPTLPKTVGFGEEEADERPANA